MGSLSAGDCAAELVVVGPAIGALVSTDRPGAAIDPVCFTAPASARFESAVIAGAWPDRTLAEARGLARHGGADDTAADFADLDCQRPLQPDVALPGWICADGWAGRRLGLRATGRTANAAPGGTRSVAQSIVMSFQL